MSSDGVLAQGMVEGACALAGEGGYASRPIFRRITGG